MHSLEYSTFPSLIFVRRYTEHPFCRAVAGCRQGKSCHQPLSEREGKGGSNTQGSRVALPGASEMSLQVFRPAKTLPIFTDSHEGTCIYVYFFSPLTFFTSLQDAAPHVVKDSIMSSWTHSVSEQFKTSSLELVLL